MKFCNLFLLSITVSASVHVLTDSSILAQVTTDGTTSTTVTPTDTGVQIDSGSRTGDNLFHSFDEFSVPTNSEAFFNNANDVVNIFSRVTGGNISNIDGTLRANGTANLFLINPAGIVFGENARLQLGGSFYGSTADSIIFPDGKFSATDLENPPLITVNAPIGLGFRDNPNSITVRGNGNGVRLTDSELIDTNEALRVDSSATIGLIGGNLIFEDATIKTPGGRIELGSVAGGEVDLVAVENGFTFDYSQINTFQDISLSGTSIIDASGLGSGEINVTGNNIAIADISGLISYTLGSIPGNDINLFAADSITVNGVANENNFVSGIFNRVLPQATADGGGINIETGNLVVGDRSIVSTFVSGTGNAGDINIDARESVSLVSQGNTSSIQSSVDIGAIGNGGNITITTPSLSLSNGAFLSSNTSGQGNAGNIDFAGNSLTLVNGAFFNANANSSQGDAGKITVNARDTVFLDGNGNSTGFFTNARTAETIGNGGEIGITTGSLTLQNGATLNASSLSRQGKSGNVIIDATDGISLLNDSNIRVLGSGGGFIEIAAKNLSLSSNGNLLAGISSDLGSTDTLAGDIKINLIEDLVVDGSISNNNLGTGNAGNIEVNARNINLSNQGQINSLSAGGGDSGKITFNVTENINFDGTNSGIAVGIIALSSEEVTGNAKDVNLTAQNLILTNGAKIESVVLGGRENNGDINLNITDTIRVEGFGETIQEDGTLDVFASRIFNSVSNLRTGNSGNIKIDTSKLELLRNGNIATNVLDSSANAGNININADLITIGESGSKDAIPSNISTTVLSSFLEETNPSEANGGNITIQTNSIAIKDGGSLQAGINGIGDGGNISITARDSISLEGSGLFDLSSGETIEVSSKMTTELLPDSIGNSGTINLDTNKLSLSDGAQISTSTFGRGNAGSIAINAAEEVILSNSSNSDNVTFISTSVQLGAVGNGGEITVSTENLNLKNGGQILSSTFSRGDAGTISINATDNVLVEGINGNFRSLISSSVFADAVGNGGQIIIDTSNFQLAKGGQIQNDTFGLGNAGTIAIEATNNMFIDGEVNELSGSVISSSVRENAMGDGGQITIKTKNLNLVKGAQISNSTSSQGNAGNIAIDATETVSLDGQDRDGFSSLISSAVQENAMGNGGEITIDTNNLLISNGASINSNTSGRGNAGSLTIRSDNRIELTGFTTNAVSGLFVGAIDSDGNGGDLNITTDRLTISDRATISASNFSSSDRLGEPGEGAAGSITIKANSLNLSDRARIDTATRSGERGNIILDVEETISLRENSSISARAFNDANGGNVTINTELIIAFPSQFDGNDIRADANRGEGGKIEIAAESVLGIAESKTLNPLTNDINASSQVAGLAGTISITTPEVNALRVNYELPKNLVFANAIATNACGSSSIEDSSNLTLGGKGGILPEIIHPLTTDSLIVDDSNISLQPFRTNQTGNNSTLGHNPTVTTDISAEIQPAIETEEKGKLYAARGIIQQEDGTVYLTAYSTSNRSRTPARLLVDCIH